MQRHGRAAILMLASLLGACPTTEGNGEQSSSEKSGVTMCLSKCDAAQRGCIAQCSEGACRASCIEMSDPCRVSCNAQAADAGSGSDEGSAGAGDGNGGGSATCISSCSEAFTMCNLGCTDSECQTSCSSSFNNCNASCSG